MLQNIVGDKGNDPALRMEAVSALSGTRAGTEWLLGLSDKSGLDDAGYERKYYDRRLRLFVGHGHVRA